MGRNSRVGYVADRKLIPRIKEVGRCLVAAQSIVVRTPISPIWMCRELLNDYVLLIG
jgi:hypothetical protein